MRSAAWSPPATRARAAASWLRVASASIRSNAPVGDGSASPWQRSPEDVAHLGANVIPDACGYEGNSQPQGIVTPRQRLHLRLFRNCARTGSVQLTESERRCSG